MELSAVEERVLLFYRGIDVVRLTCMSSLLYVQLSEGHGAGFEHQARIEGLFIGRKIDLLLDMALKKPLGWLWAWVTGRRPEDEHLEAQEPCELIEDGKEKCRWPAKTAERNTLR